MRTDRQHLELHYGKWRVKIAVPTVLREHFGKAHLVRPLNTSDLQIATRLKHEAIAELRREIERARALTEGHVPFLETAVWVKEKGASLAEIDGVADELEFRVGEANANLWHEVALGFKTPIRPLVDKWLKDKSGWKSRQKHDYKRAVMKLEAHYPLVEEVTRKRAFEYINVHFANAHPRTTNKDISCLSSFWKWMMRRGVIEGENPWLQQGVSEKELQDHRINKRPFTDDEVVRLLDGHEEGSLLGDAMRIAALSGMRVSEIAKLTVADVLDGSFRVQDAKTKAGNRLVPIHTALSGLVETRLRCKCPSDRLFAELPVLPKDSPMEPGQAITKRFGRYRKSLGIGEQLDGARQSDADFHSFRRWFITKAHNARQPVHFIEAVVGHKPQSFSLSVYSGGPDVEHLRAVVESVHLP